MATDAKLLFMELWSSLIACNIEQIHHSSNWKTIWLQFDYMFNDLPQRKLEATESFFLGGDNCYAIVYVLRSHRNMCV